MAVHLRYQAMKAASQKRRNVDTKASKGRKIRYDIHQKLVGFMAPVTVEPETRDPISGITAWPELKVDALIQAISAVISQKQ